jgi:predicted DNA binding CopG/RHH family protein
MYMKGRSKKGVEDKWKDVAELFEGDKGIDVMKKSRVLSNVERRRLLGAGKTKLVSLRVPEEDLEALKGIAEAHSRKYQQLMVVAVEQFLDRYYDVTSKKRTG